MEKLFDVAGKRVLITGGSRGIGAMIARGFLAHGAEVFIAARKIHEVEATVEALKPLGPVEGFRLDLTNVDEIDAFKDAIAERTDRLDVLVNNAGAAWGQPLDTFTPEAWDKVMDTNVRGVFFMVQKFLPLVKAAAAPGAPARIINIGSIDGLRPPPLETYPYSASKAAVHHLTRTLAARLAPDNILVNALAPGPFESKMMAGTLQQFGDQIRAANPLGRIGEPEDIAGAAIFLASRASAYITGAVLPVDGGEVSTRSM